MTPETARRLIERERAANPDVVVLARHLSLAVRIEVELLRAMRLEGTPWIEPGVEADLYFSSLVLVRDLSAIAFIPEVRAELGAELALHKAELERAREVTARAHRDMDAVIGLEEMVVYEAMRGDRNAHRSMQRRLGTLAVELEKPNVDPDLLHWTATALPRMPAAARLSEAGREVERRLADALTQLGGGPAEPTSPSAMRSVVPVGIRVRGDALALRQPVPEGWLGIDMLGPSPVQVEVGWPVPGGWRTRTLELKDGKTQEIEDVPLGLLRLRAANGDETKLRIEGPFAELKPDLLVLSSGTHLPGLDVTEGEADDLQWRVRREWLPHAGPPQIFVATAKSDERRFEALADALRNAGLRPLQTSWVIEAGGDWRKQLTRALESKSRGAIVLWSRDSLRALSAELEVLERRLSSEPDFPFCVLRGEESDPALPGFLAQRQWATDPVSAARALQEELAAKDGRGAAAACLISFGSPSWLSDFIDDLRDQDSPESALPRQIDALVADSRPLLVRVDTRVERVPPYEASDDPANADRSPAAARFEHVLAVLDRLAHALVDGRRQAGGDVRAVLRRELLRGERRVIDDWIEAHAGSARTPSDPPEAMVMIQWERWFPEGKPRPLRFNQYRSSQKRLRDVAGTGGALWVVTSRRVGTSRQYRLAYRLRNTRSLEPSAQDRRDKEPVVVGTDWGDVGEFPDHDATDLLLSLQFTTGQPLQKPGDIGRRLRSIPQLTRDDVERLDTFVEALGSTTSEAPEQAADVGASAEPQAEPEPSGVFLWYEDGLDTFADRVADILQDAGIDIADVRPWRETRETGDPSLRSFARRNSVHYARGAQAVVDRIRSVLGDVVELEAEPNDGSVEMFPGSTWTMGADKVYLFLVEPPGDLPSLVESLVGRIQALQKELASRPLAGGREFSDALDRLLAADRAAASALLGAREELLSERGSFDSEEASAIVEDIAGIVNDVETRLPALHSPQGPGIVARTHLRIIADRHDRLARSLRGTNKPLRMSLGTAAGGLEEALQPLRFLAAIPLLYASSAEREALPLAQSVEALLGGRWRLAVQPTAIEDEKAVLGALPRADLVLVFATEALLRHAASDDRWLSLLDARARDDDVVVLTLGLGVREPLERLSSESRALQRVVHLDEDKVAKAADAGELEQYYRDAVGEVAIEVAGLLFDDLSLAHRKEDVLPA